MLRKTFETEIKKVKDDVLMLGSMVEESILNTVDALKKRDMKAAQKILEGDRAINKKRFEIESQLMILIATQQPMAHDLRVLASTLEIISELERMGDYAKGIANINIRMGNEALLKPLIDVPRMAEKGVDMLHRALSASGRGASRRTSATCRRTCAPDGEDSSTRPRPRRRRARPATRTRPKHVLPGERLPRTELESGRER